jgi:hypothetical protein
VDEQAWQHGTDYWPMLKEPLRRGLASERKLRLFVSACLRRTLPADVPAWLSRALDALDHHADSGAVDPARLADAILQQAAGTPGGVSHDHRFVVADVALNRDALAGAEVMGLLLIEAGAGIAREVWGNPFRPVTVAPAWLSWNGGAVARLAQDAYHERQLPSGHLDPARLLVLADALEESGCTDRALLEHLR